ncbi:hypothetical protein FPQ18DRAFT_402129 [Pyronema domesticum]|uniref:Similar to ankyrin repeat protein [Ajellomyces dermatitidis ER-3] acc. no. EEQ85046 n=1 Tax=Pyronema omphalodes (strain CBS 100304) TaxID=1076935 RepID=U4L693_PYROM|nr:hypothetical protein FPQ18DRAFT_402129 [Pyronema domesticum]CCX12880.1 Similar to ankyrin repeat protein [Ajellomyces dermatitidis ER-3]; acc. no. EEQ85046 [Pyronema omphalodes CBS 100304]
MEYDAVLSRMPFILKTKILDDLFIDRKISGGQIDRPTIVLTITDGCVSGENERNFLRVMHLYSSWSKTSPYANSAARFAFGLVGSNLEARDQRLREKGPKEAEHLTNFLSSNERNRSQLKDITNNKKKWSILKDLLLGGMFVQDEDLFHSGQPSEKIIVNLDTLKSADPQPLKAIDERVEGWKALVEFDPDMVADAWADLVVVWTEPEL